MFKKLTTFFAFISVFCTGVVTSNNARDLPIDNKTKLAILERKQTKIDEKNLDEPTDIVNSDTRIFKDNAYSNHTTFNKITYFENLYDYSPNNNIGSCGFVSFIQLLSYYDTFYNDSVIPEQFDRKLTTATTESEAKAVSPGVLRQVYYGSGYSSYYEYCHATMGSDLQSYFTVLYNQYLNSDNVDNFKYSIGAWNYNAVLRSFYNDSSLNLVTTYSTSSQSNYMNWIKTNIDNGDPVIVHIRKRAEDGTTSGAHSVVAYAYDEGGIYAHFGWGRSSSTYTLLGGTANYNEIYYAARVDFSSLGHSHSDNYIINGTPYCGCNISDKVFLKTGGNNLKVPPTLYWMKNLYDPDETFTISIRKNSVITTSLITFTSSENQVTLSVDDWNTILINCSSNYYVVIKRNSTLENYNEKKTPLSVPTKGANYITVSPAEYGFEQQYFFEEKTAEITQGDYSFTTKRLRTGFIENQYINLSANRLNAGTAYLEYYFSQKVGRIDFDMSFWSDSEGLRNATGTAVVQYKKSNGTWVTVLDLLNDVTLKTSRLLQDTFTIVFPEAVTSFRFYSTFYNPQNASQNKGRICLGDLSVYFD